MVSLDPLHGWCPCGFVRLTEHLASTRPAHPRVLGASCAWRPSHPQPGHMHGRVRLQGCDQTLVVTMVASGCSGSRWPCGTRTNCTLKRSWASHTPWSACAAGELSNLPPGLVQKHTTRKPTRSMTGLVVNKPGSAWQKSVTEAPASAGPGRQGSGEIDAGRQVSFLASLLGPGWLWSGLTMLHVGTSYAQAIRTIPTIAKRRTRTCLV